MAQREGAIRVARRENRVTYEVIGRVTMLHARALRRDVDAHPGRFAIHVDLRDCAYMDSTFLGTLLSLKRMAEATRRGFALVSPSPLCTRLLQQMGLDGVFPTIDAPPAEGPWEPLAADPDEVAALKRHLVEAHQELANTPGPAGESFRDLACRLAREWESEERRRRRR